jgi:serine/threonine protein kinase
VPTSLPDFTGGAISLAALPYKYLDDLEITVIDFGSAEDDQGPLYYTITTWPYRAPEVSDKRGWSFPCDIWSIGCTLYELHMDDLTTLPSFHKSRCDYLESGDDTHYGNEFVASFRRLLARMLDPDPENRITAAEALEDPWFKMTMFDFGQLLQRNPTGPSYVPGMMTPGIIVKLSEGPLLWLLEYWGEKKFDARALKEDVADLLREDDLSVIPAAMLPAEKAETYEQKLAVFLQNRSAGRLLEHIVDELFTGDKFPHLHLPETMSLELITDLTTGPLFWLFEYSGRKDFDSNAIHTAMKDRLSEFQLSFVPEAIQSASKARGYDGKLKAFFHNQPARRFLKYIVHEFLSKEDKFPDLHVPDIMTTEIVADLIEGPLSWIFEFYDKEDFDDDKCNLEKHMKDRLWDFDLCFIHRAVQLARQVGSCEEKLGVFLQHPAAGPLLKLILDHNPNVAVPEKMTPKIIEDPVDKPLYWLFKYLNRDDFDAEAIKAAIENSIWKFTLPPICKDIESADIHGSSKRRLFRFFENRQSGYLLLAVVERLSTDVGKYADLLGVCRKKKRFATMFAAQNGWKLNARKPTTSNGPEMLTRDVGHSKNKRQRKTLK